MTMEGETIPMWMKVLTCSQLNNIVVFYKSRTFIFTAFKTKISSMTNKNYNKIKCLQQKKKPMYDASGI